MFPKIAEMEIAAGGFPPPDTGLNLDNPICPVARRATA